MAIEQYPLVLGRGDETIITAVYRETLPDGTAGDPVDISGMSADVVVSDSLEALAADVAVTDGPGGEVTATISAANSLLWPINIRFRLRVLDDEEPTTILTGPVTYG